jgi:hypothetical protein
LLHAQAVETKSPIGRGQTDVQTADYGGKNSAKGVGYLLL